MGHHGVNYVFNEYQYDTKIDTKYKTEWQRDLELESLTRSVSVRMRLSSSYRAIWLPAINERHLHFSQQSQYAVGDVFFSLCTTVTSVLPAATALLHYLFMDRMLLKTTNQNKKCPLVDRNRHRRPFVDNPLKKMSLSFGVVLHSMYKVKVRTIVPLSRRPTSEALRNDTHCKRFHSSKSKPMHLSANSMNHAFAFKPKLVLISPTPKGWKAELTDYRQPPIQILTGSDIN